MSTREEIAVALFSKIEAPLRDAGAVLVSRRLLHWNDVAVVDMPAAFLAQGNQQPTPSPAGSPTTWRMNFNIYIYVNETDPAQSPSTKLNALLDVVESSLAPSRVGLKQQLGGTVEHCWISGTVETDEGVLGNLAMAVVPVEVLYVT